MHVPTKRLAIAVPIAVLAGALGVAGTALAGGGHGGSHNPPHNPPSPTAVTRAAIDPSLVAGRGASVAFAEQEAEKASTNGTIIGPSQDAYTLPAEASGRSAVQLAKNQYVEFTLPRDTNAVTVRYAIPDAPTGGGITAPLSLKVGNQTRTITLTSKYSWLYNLYPFTNDPNAGVLHPDWWITECGCVPGDSYQVTTPFRPFHFYDEQRVLLDRTYPAGTTLRLSVPGNTPAAWTIIDLLDSELVGRPAIRPNAVSVLSFGADPTGRHDSANAFDAAIVAAKARHKTVFIPPGTYQVNRHIIVDNVTIEGAGSWYTIIKGSQVTLSQPAADGSIHGGVGFYGKYAQDGGSSNVHLSGFSIIGDVAERIDTDQVNGIGGALSNSSIEDLYIQHTKVGMWFDGPINHLTIKDNIIVDQIADGLNFHKGVTNSTAAGNFIRNTGDDAMALWSDTVENASDTFDHNTVQSPTLANGIAVYGGRNTTISNNLVADPLREGAGLHAGSRFGATAFAGTLAFTNNTTVRASTKELNWNFGLGAIWIYLLEGSITADVEITGDNFLQNQYHAIQLVADFGVKDLYSLPNVHFKDIHVDGAGQSVVSARLQGSATFQNVDVRNVGWWGVDNCGAFNFAPTGSEFTLVDQGGNDGVDNDEYHPGTNWLSPYLPNAITCNDYPPLVAPPAPSAW